MIQRTTIAAESDDLETVRAEARRRGLSLAQYMTEVVAERAAAIRASRQPRYGVGRSGTGGAARESVDEEAAPARTPYKS